MMGIVILLLDFLSLIFEMSSEMEFWVISGKVVVVWWVFMWYIGVWGYV